jgi:hypothetical protein
MSQSNSKADRATQLTEAYARRDDLRQSLLAMNGGNRNLYSGLGRNEGYDSLLCALRGEEAVIDELSCAQSKEARKR